ncbi:MAG: Gfo/Idh/MocA family oxidoreductase [Planctomycetes bacterium]|nr:Gfo/Idh/MocA family oxidoreductase [Planctomycetota bacterium]
MFTAAVIGCGNIGPVHARAYRSTREIRLGAVVDIVPERAEKVGREHDVPWYTDVGKVLRRRDIDFIDVCVPSGLHGTIALRAARAGKHCISEKPLDVTPQRCDRIIEAFRKSGTTLGGIFGHRFADGSLRTKAAIDAGRLGRITLATCSTPWWRSQEYYDSGDWRGTWKLDGGGCLMNQGIHAIDQLIWFCGPIARITARTAMLAHERIEVEDVAVATVEFASGALGVILGTTAAYPGDSVRHEIMGTAGMIHLADDKPVLWKLRDEMEAAPADSAAGAAPAPGADTGASSDPLAVSDDIFVRNIDDVARAAREGREPLVSGPEARLAVEAIGAIYRSAQTGKPVTLPLKRFVPRHGSA